MFTVRPFEARTLIWWHNERANINMNPPYQRRSGLWTTRDRAYLIDSIINGFDIPKLYIADFTYVNTPLNQGNKPYAVIDGKQRLSAIFDFLDGALTLDAKFRYFKRPDLDLGGLSYKDLKSRYADVASSFENFNLTIMSVITDEEDKINELFVRLNRSKPLTGAELRNAMIGVVPSLIREIAAHEFFKSRISFNVSRGQDLNAAAKLLLIEYQERFVGTTKPNLDRLVEEGSANESKITRAAQRVVENLNDMAEIFTPSDPLLKSQGPLTIYYWLVRNTLSHRKSVLREFLLKFEQDRRKNREKAKSPAAKNIDEELLNYDIQNRSTDNQGTLENRYRILLSRLAGFG